jgi:hypothetical protein
MATMADVYRALNAMRDEGIVDNFAIGGGMAALFYAETTATFDVDVFVMIPHVGLLIDLSRIYDWARGRGYKIENEYLMIHGVPVQILVAGGELQSEAVQTAQQLDYDGVPVPVMKPEYLILLYLQAGSAKRRGRAADLKDAGIDEALVSQLATRFELASQWNRVKSDGV